MKAVQQLVDSQMSQRVQVAVGSFLGAKGTSISSHTKVGV
jgi:hypothetical protein